MEEKEDKFRKHVYCDVCFLEFLASAYENCLYKTADLRKSAAIKSLYNLITDSYIVLHINKHFFDEKICSYDNKMRESARKEESICVEASERIIKEIELKSGEGKLQVVDSANMDLDTIISSIKNEKNKIWSNSVILTGDQENVNVRTLSQEIGILIITPHTIGTIETLLIDCGSAINKNSHGKWSDYIKSEIPCNSMVIVDNYLLNNQQYVDENLKPLFSSLLPKNLSPSIKFELLIFTTLKEYKDGQLVKLDPEPALNYIQGITKRLRGNMNFDITLYVCEKGAFHDRCILTNNLWISCGAGFDLFKEKIAQKQTTLSITSTFLNISQPWLTQAVSDLIGKLRSMMKNTGKYGENGVNKTFTCYSIKPEDLETYKH